MNEINYKFRGVDVFFAPAVDNDVMINATELLKQYPGKRMNNFLRSEHTKALIKQLESETSISASQLVVVIKGNYSDGRTQGTWMYEKLALAFALWLDPEFFSWCLGKIKELLTNGYAIKDSEINNLINNNTALQSIVDQLTPKAQYYDKVLNDTEYKYNFTQICQSLRLNIGRKDLVRLLIDNGYAFRDKNGKGFYLKTPWSFENYIGTVTCLDKKTGRYRNAIRWSEYGRAWLDGLTAKWGIPRH